MLREHLTDCHQHDYVRSRRRTVLFSVLLLLLFGGCGLLVGFLPLFLLVWLVLVVKIHDATVCKSKCILIQRLFRDVSQRLEAFCAPGAISEGHCRNSLFFPSRFNAFYMNPSFPRLLCGMEREGFRFQYSLLSVGEYWRSGYELALSRTLCHAEGRICDQGVLFYCHVPFHFTSLRLFLPRKWGQHLGTGLGACFPGGGGAPPVSLIDHVSTSCWCYGTPREDEHDWQWQECYFKLRDYPGSCLSFMGSSIYVYVPFRCQVTPSAVDPCGERLERLVREIQELVMRDLCQSDSARLAG